MLVLALILSGLSPYGFSSWSARSDFQWIPLVEYYDRTTASALADAICGLLNYALLGGLLALSFPKQKAQVVIYAVALAAAIELGQTMVPTRSPGVTDILIAALGSYVGLIICHNIEAAKSQPDDLLTPSFC